MPVAHSKTGLLAPHPRSRRRNQRGFALLLVFLMASIVAIMLYMELPRAAMQAQRDKEEMLIDRGEQYKRAIQLFVTKTHRYPAEIKDLENFNNQRFLRQRYADPMTGKDEWRLVHIQNGMLTDSKVTKPNAPGGKTRPPVAAPPVCANAGAPAKAPTRVSRAARRARDRAASIPPRAHRSPSPARARTAGHCREPLPPDNLLSPLIRPAPACPDSQDTRVFRDSPDSRPTRECPACRGAPGTRPPSRPALPPTRATPRWAVAVDSLVAVVRSSAVAGVPSPPTPEIPAKPCPIARASCRARV